MVSSGKNSAIFNSCFCLLVPSAHNRHERRSLAYGPVNAVQLLVRHVMFAVERRVNAHSIEFPFRQSIEEVLAQDSVAFRASLTRTARVYFYAGYARAALA